MSEGRRHLLGLAASNPSEKEPEGFDSEADVLTYLAKHRERLEFMVKRYPLECLFPLKPPGEDDRVLHYIRIVLQDTEHLRRIMDKKDIKA